MVSGEEHYLSWVFKPRESTGDVKQDRRQQPGSGSQLSPSSTRARCWAQVTWTVLPIFRFSRLLSQLRAQPPRQLPSPSWNAAPSEAERAASSTRTGSQRSPVFTCPGAGSGRLGQSPQRWQPAPKQILVQLRHSVPPSRSHALNVEAPSSPLASSPAERFLSLYQ